jgi:4-carboxymuconolactone decarboxylase
MMSSRDELRRKGNEIRERLQHGANPSGGRLRAVASVPGLRNFTGESIFGAVWSRPGLDIRYRMLATLSVLSSLQRLSQLKTYVHSALTLGLGPEEIQEALIHCCLYAGFPTTVNSLEAAHEAFSERGIEVPQTDVPEVSLEEMESRGRELREKLMGVQDQGGYVNALNDLAPDLRRLTLQFGFGEIFYRPGLDLKSRVVCSTAALTALRANAQLRNFLQAGLRVGFSKEEMVEVLIQTGGYAGYPAALSAISTAAEVWE